MVGEFSGHVREIRGIRPKTTTRRNHSRDNPFARWWFGSPSVTTTRESTRDALAHARRVSAAARPRRGRDGRRCRSLARTDESPPTVSSPVLARTTDEQRGEIERSRVAGETFGTRVANVRARTRRRRRSSRPRRRPDDGNETNVVAGLLLAHKLFWTVGRCSTFCCKSVASPPISFEAMMSRS